MIEFEPILPYSIGSEVEVTVGNNMDYPIEMYSLEFDKDYLIEEEVRQRERVSDCMNNIIPIGITLGKRL